ncbi:MAG TPA: DUF3383 family protein [Gemmataceae bacterium]|nr:DUF3383 family protein [Gemmataceae bacterium]
MAISLSKYVDITSGVGAANNVPTRSLGALVITNNSLCPTGTKLDFTSAADVGDYFGTTSEEYARAVFYFGWVSKNITSPQVLSFYFWNNDTATHDLIFGAPPIDSLVQFNSITAGQLTLTMGGTTHTLTSIDLSAAGSLAAVATDITTAIQAYSAGGAQWTGATVTYDSTSGAFNLVSGSTGTDTIEIAAAPSNDLAGPLGWLSSKTVLSNGTAAQTLPDLLDQLIDQTNNFGSFCFTNGLALSLTTVEAAAEWNNSLNPNIQFIYSVPVTVANASSWAAALAEIGGVTLTLAPLATEYPEMVPMMILAATDYNAINAVQNYEFQEFNLTPSVTTNADYQTYTGLRINFYGQTQTAGQLIQFYQQGVMMGLAVDPLDQNTYANEIWLKDALGAALMNLLLALSQVPANNTGRAQVLATLQSVINVALQNGTISVGRTLTVQQQLYIAQVTGSSTAWQQVQNAGYWVGATIQSYMVGGVTEYKIVYTLIYAKDDVIRLIEGSDILI